MKRLQPVILIFVLSQVLSSCIKLDESELGKGILDLYVYDFQTNTNRQITNTPDIYEFPVGFSGEKIVYKDNDGVSNMNVDGSGKELVLSSGSFTEFHVSGNGKYIFIKDGNIFIMNSDGTGLSQITDTPLNFFAPELSPDGKYISACCDNGFILINLLTGVTDVINRSKPSSLYDWSSNSGKLTYSIYINNFSQVFSYDVATKHEVQLTDNQKFNYFPKWRKGSDQIIFASALADYGSDLVLMNSDGSSAELILHDNGLSYPVCSPSGNQVAFINQDGDLGICDMTGQNYKVLNNLPGGCLEPSWSDDGRYILYYRAFPEL
jgi:Tol biopolymer transport system component